MDKNKKGFTLVELIVVIAIVGILAGILMPILISFIKDSKQAKADTNAKNIHTCAISAFQNMEKYDEKLADNTYDFDDFHSASVDIKDYFKLTDGGSADITISGGAVTLVEYTSADGNYTSQYPN